MLTEERQKFILDTLNKKGIVKVNELVKTTDASESTIRRDLTHLEDLNKLKRVHGGATLLEGRYNEASFKDKLIHKQEEKVAIAKHAASLIEDGDSIYLDAGTTIYEMTQFINQKDIFVVTNGIDNVEPLLEKGINVYILGGKIKSKTKAVTGVDAITNLSKFRFDKAFLGMNAIHLEYDLTTPDTEEAKMKEKAIDLSGESFVLVDDSKFNKVSFVKVADLDRVTVITNKENRHYEEYLQKTDIEVGTE
ncbi:DeoR/GlpR transcriptional regulator [Clostridium sp. D2Q-14]|uniref:DeoR/GlpR family DNA-binding transcription regulator n=1 Tax=Anaeromonas gelatinilytica TaxID=2683194 RepID=UPI00193BE20F|nr:DeoR/GlpR family DNA-binding transcription regulator [Anaeromonas gelatinilytica]MBS4534503.1 DeoR/GlpR transcriptional regulator [Anaeromonas gelatinilytica]